MEIQVILAVARYRTVDTLVLVHFNLGLGKCGMKKGKGGAGCEAGTCLWKYMSVQNTGPVFIGH